MPDLPTVQDSPNDALTRLCAPAAAPRAPALSIVVCTYNRCEKLPQALEAIGQACRDHHGEVELVVVDNNSSDGTETVIEDFSRSCALTVCYVREARQGLSFARNRGVGEARGRIVAFTDDDCIVARDWVAVILREMGDRRDVGLIGGRVDLHDPDDRPVSIRPLDRRVRYREIGHVLTLIMGCNFAFRRELVDRIGLFDPAFGCTNGVTGDDIDFIYRAVRQGVGVEFVPDMAARHDHGRRRDDEIDRLNAGYVRGRGAFYAKFALRGDSAVLRVACREVAAEFRLIVRRLWAGETIGANLLFLLRLLSGALRLARSRIERVTDGRR